MRASSGREATYFLFAATLLSLGAQGFLGPLTIPHTTTGQRGKSSASRSRVPRVAAMPPQKSGGGGGSAAAGGDENGAGFGGDVSKRMSRAPLRITPNIQPQAERRPKTSADQDNTYGAFLTEESFDIAAMAWAEFSDWLRRTIGRNVEGVQFEFDTRQWSSSIRKWSTRAVEMDVQAKADLFRLYERGIKEREAWGNQAVKVDARVEDEWDSIYVECQDCFDGNSDAGSGSGSVFESRATGVSGGGGVGDASAGTGAGAVRSPAYSSMRREGPWSATSSELSAFDVYLTGEEGAELVGDYGEEEEEDEDEDAAGDSEGFEEEDIIDCAIRGRWTFENNDDPPHFSPQ